MFSSVIKPFEMLIEKEWPCVVDTDAFEESIPVKKGVVCDTCDGFVKGLNLSVQPNEFCHVRMLPWL